MQPITVKDYITTHYSSFRFDLIELLKALQPDPDDRDLVEQEIKDAVTEILEDENTESSLKNVASAIAISQFRNLRSNPVNDYWNALKLRKKTNQNAIDSQEAANSHLGDSVLESYNTGARAKQSAATEDKDVFEIDGVALDGMEKSVGSTLKSEALKLAKAKRTFSDLSEEAKNTVFLGLNSIVDLSNNSTAPGTQRSFFPGSSWQQLKKLAYESRTMPPLPANVKEDLKEIEQIAISDLKQSYQLCLRLQAKHAFTPEESFFEIYAHAIRLLHRKNTVLKTERSKNATEQDFVNEAWTPIMAAIFNDDDLVLKWGDSVSQTSASAKKRSLPEENVLGDRVDLRVMVSINGSMHDVLTGEFANSKLGPWKFTSDHLKVLRESKVILDHIVNQEFTAAHDARRLIVPSFQANGLDGEVNIMKLYAPGLYTVQHIGSVDIPGNINCLSDLRKKTIPRLRFIKYHASKNARILSKSLEKEAKLKKRKSTSYKRSPSCDDVETDTKWTRSTWFPSPRPGAPIVIPTDMF